MKGLIILSLLSYQVFAAGTMSTDSTPASQAEASLSGVQDKRVKIQKEEEPLIKEETVKEIKAKQLKPLPSKKSY